MSIERSEPPKVQVVLYLGFDEESEKALKLTWDVAQEILEEYGIWVEVIPFHIWIHDPSGLFYPDLPRIEVNGKVMAIGRIPSREELIDIILSRVFSREAGSNDLVVIAATQRNDNVFEDSILSLI